MFIHTSMHVYKYANAICHMSAHAICPCADLFFTRVHIHVSQKLAYVYIYTHMHASYVNMYKYVHGMCTHASHVCMHAHTSFLVSNHPTVVGGWRRMRRFAHVSTVRLLHIWKGGGKSSDSISMWVKNIKSRYTQKWTNMFMHICICSTSRYTYTCMYEHTSICVWVHVSSMGRRDYVYACSHIYLCMGVSVNRRETHVLTSICVWVCRWVDVTTLLHPYTNRCEKTWLCLCTHTHIDMKGRDHVTQTQIDVCPAQRDDEKTWLRHPYTNRCVCVCMYPHVFVYGRFDEWTWLFLFSQAYPKCTHLQIHLNT